MKLESLLTGLKHDPNKQYKNWAALHSIFDWQEVACKLLLLGAVKDDHGNINYNSNSHSNIGFGSDSNRTILAAYYNIDEDTGLDPYALQIDALKRFLTSKGVVADDGA